MRWEGVYFTRIEGIVRPGRRVANGFQSRISGDMLGITLRKAKAEPEIVADRLEKIFQPERKIQEIMVPYFPEFFKLISNNEPRPYKGVSFNPFVLSPGESLNILDFYSWIKKAEFRGVVLDASMYAVVNASGESPVNLLSSDAARNAVDFMKSRIQLYPEIKKSARIREEYLRASASYLFESRKPMIFSAEEIWEDRNYIECLQEALEFCTGNRKGDLIDITRYADYKRYGKKYQRWYTVFVLSESLYMNRKYGVNIKLGPTSESNFDSLIRKFMKSRGVSFGFVWYNRDIEKEIPYTERPLFTENKKTVERKLSNIKLNCWVAEIMTPFKFEGERTLDAVLRVIRDVRERTASYPQDVINL